MCYANRKQNEPKLLPLGSFYSSRADGQLTKKKKRNHTVCKRGKRHEEDKKYSKGAREKVREKTMWLSGRRATISWADH